VDLNNADESASLSNNSTNIQVTSNDAITGAGNSFATAGVTKLVITNNGNFTGQTITFAGTAAYSLAGGLNSSGVATDLFQQAVTATGSAAVSVTATQNILVLANLTGGTGGTTLLAQGAAALDTVGVTVSSAVVTATGSGAVSVTGTGGAFFGENIGVWISGAGAQITSGGGAVSVTGTGGSGPGNSSNNYGVYLLSGGQVSAGGTGTVTVTGTGGVGSNGGDTGVYVSGPGSTITSAGGNVSVTGQGGAGDASGTRNDGVLLDVSGLISSGGGTVTVVGTGGGNDVSTPGDLNIGVNVQLSAEITSGGGDVSVTGTGGDSTVQSSSQCVGVSVSQATISSGGGSVTVRGTGGNSGGSGFSNQGVQLGQAMITSGGGNVSVTGFGGAGGVGSKVNAGVFFAGGEITSGGAGSVTVTGTGGGGSFSHGVIVQQTGTEITSGGGGAVSVTGTGGDGGQAGSNNYGVYAVNGGQITSGGSGGVTVTGNGGADSVTNNFGVYVTGASSAITSGGGNVSVTGTGGGGSAASPGSSADGVVVNSAGQISSGGAGTVTVAGTAGRASATFSFGVTVTTFGQINSGGAGSVTVTGNTDGAPGTGPVGVGLLTSGKITSGGGDVHVTGQCGTGTGIGVLVSGPAVITSGGTGSVTVSGTGGQGDGGVNDSVEVTGLGALITSGGAGSLTVNGSDAGGFTSQGTIIGVSVQNAGKITSGGGNVAVTGHGGKNSATDAEGVSVGSGGLITAGGAGTVTVAGTGGSNAGGLNFGVEVNGIGSVIYSGGGAVSVTGTGGSGTSPYGLYLTSSGSITTDVNGGDLTLTADSMNFDPGVDVLASASNTITLENQSIDVEINLGGADVFGPGATLGLTDSELHEVGGGKLVIGRDDLQAPGGMIISSPITRAFATDLTLVGKAGILPVASGTDFDLAGGTLHFAGTLALDSTINSATPDSGYNRLVVNGTVDLTGLELLFAGSYTPVAGDAFTLVQATSLLNTFNNVSNGASQPLNGVSLLAGYAPQTFTLTANVSPQVQHLYVTFGSHGTYDLLGSARLDVPWQITGIQLVFNEAVTATANSLSLAGVNVASYGASGFSGSGTSTLSWTLSSPITADRVSLSLTGVTSTLGMPLNGGSAYTRNFAVLYGDYNGDGFVTSADLVAVRNLVAGGSYNIFADVNGDGVVDLSDVNLIRALIGTKLP
jgi:hypothetical protein